MTIKITKFTKRENDSSLKAYFNIVVEKWGNFYINDMKLFEKNGSRFVTFPDKEYTKDGEKKYAANCGFTERNVSTSFQNNVLKAIDEFCMQNRDSRQDQCEIPF